MDRITIKADSADIYVADIANYFSSKILFNDQIIQSDGQHFFSRICDILLVAGVKMKPSRVIPHPFQVAEVLFTSLQDGDIADEQRAAEAKIMVEKTDTFSSCVAYGQKDKESRQKVPQLCLRAKYEKARSAAHWHKNLNKKIKVLPTSEKAKKVKFSQHAKRSQFRL